MRILVFGAGAVGSALGGLLARAGHAVTLLCRPHHMNAVRERGLRIRGLWGDHHVTAIEAAARVDDLGERAFDLILLTVKSYDTHAAVEALRLVARSDAAIVSVQNGYGNTQAIEAGLGRDRVFGARIITGIEQPEPGCILVTVSADEIRLGPPAGEPEWMPRAEQLAQTLRDAGIPAAATNQYREYLWSKIVYNCALNPLGALLRATYGEVVADSGTRALIDAIIDEAFMAAGANGIPMFWPSAREYRSHFYDELIPPTAAHYPSMLRDLERRGRTEIDALNGAVVRLAETRKIDVPVNRALTAMIKLRERTRQNEMKAG